MRKVPNRPRAGSAIVLAVTAAVVTASAGLFAITVDPATGWTPDLPSQVAAVPATPWTPASQDPASVPPFVDGTNPASVRGTVNGTGPATLTGTPAKAAGAGSALSVKTASLTGTVPLTAPAPVPANAQGAGDFTALPGASSGSWGVTGQTGGFTWSYPFSTRKAPAGPTPSLGLAYDSSAIDGLTSATNNQASTIGDGWSLAGAGSIRQKFAPCMDQGMPAGSTYDLCGNPGGQQFSISFGGRSGQVIKDTGPGGMYKLQNDDNTKVEYLTDNTNSNGTFDGGYWKLTDTSGTQYFFGRNHLPGWIGGNASTNSADTVPVGAATPTQPCAAGTFAQSLCQQAYAWNLDYVVDVNNNSEAFYYTQDTNNYTTQAGTGLGC